MIGFSCAIDCILKYDNVCSPPSIIGIFFSFLINELILIIFEIIFKLFFKSFSYLLLLFRLTSARSPISYIFTFSKISSFSSNKKDSICFADVTLIASGPKEVPLPKVVVISRGTP